MGRTRLCLQGHAVTLTFKAETQMFLRDTSSQYTCSYQLCEIVLKFDFKIEVMGRTLFCCKVMML